MGNYAQLLIQLDIYKAKLQQVLYSECIVSRAEFLL